VGGGVGFHHHGKVTGIGGVFFKSKGNGAALSASQVIWPYEFPENQ
jgi:hypothetical protein